MPKLRLPFLAVLLSMLLPSAVAQTTVRVPADQLTIQAGINAAKNGDTVLVAPGTYYENIDFKGKAITVTSSGGSSGTFIDGGGTAAVVTFQTQETRSSIVAGFTLRNGGAPASTTYLSPAGVLVSGAGPTIRGNIITANQCVGVDVSFGSALIIGNTISNTTGYSSGFCDFGGGITLRGNGGTGGNTHSDVIGNIIENNKVGYADAGAITLWAAEGSLIQGNTIRFNQGDAAGAIFSANTDRMSILGNLMYGNANTSASFDTGGALAILPPGQSAGDFIGIIAGNTIVNNTSPASTYADSPSPSQVMLQGNLGQYVMVNNIIASSSAQPAMACGTTYNYLSYTPLVFDHNDIYNSGGPAYGGACSSQSGSYGNISADPQFVNAASADFHLRSGSPAIDTGNNSAPSFATVDLDGQPRPVDATGLGYPVMDMGVYEASGLYDAAPTILTLSPSTYYPYQGFPYGPANAPFILTATAASKAGIPTGPITFYEDGVSVGTANLDAAGKTTLQPPVPTPGVHAFTSTYPGQGSYPPAVSVKFFVLFPKYTTTLTLASSANPSTLGSAVTFTVKISSSDNTFPSPITLTDTTTNTVIATLTPDATGAATFTISSLTAGYHYITANYAGDSTHGGASAYLQQQVVDPHSTSTTVSGTPNPSVFNQAVTITATVTSSGGGTPTGVVNFSYGSASLGSATLVGSAANTAQASISTTALPVGFDQITATYVPTGGYVASNGSYYQQVLSGYTTSTNLSSSLNPSSFNQSVTFTARVTSSNGTPTGSVSFTDGSTVLGSQALNSTGVSTLTTATLAAGAHTIVATYTPSALYAASSAQLTQQVNGYPTASTLAVTASGPNAGDPVTLTATVSTSATGTPTGTLTFFSDGTPLASAVAIAGGTATLTTTSLRAGTHALTCSYSGDGVFTASACPAVSITVSSLPTVLTLATSGSPSPALAPVTFTARLTARGNPYTGAIVFSVNGKPANTVPTDANGLAAFTVPYSTGTYAVTAQFAGSTGVDASSASLTQTVIANPTTIAVAPPAGALYQNQSAAFTITVAASTGTSSPNGTIALYEGTRLLGLTTTQPSVSGITVASVTIPATFAAAGTHALYASFAPDINFTASASASLTITVAPQTFTLSASSTAMSVQAEHHIAFTAGVQSVGGFSGPVRIACTPPPDLYFTCDIDKVQLQLAANGTASAGFILDTDAVLRFKSALGPNPTQHSNGFATYALATLLPLSIIGLTHRGRARSSGGKALPTLLAAICFLALAAITGCSSKYPAHTPPGTYDIPITATGTSTGSAAAVTQTLHLTVTVTP